MYGRFLMLVAGVCAILAVVSTGAQSQPAQPRFTSGGVQVVANRAVLSRGAYGPQLVISLVLTNLGDDDVAILASERPRVVTDAGGTAEADRVSGIQLATCAPDCIGQFGITPTLIEKSNSITVTMVFLADAGRKVCSVDFSMPVFIQRGGGGGRDSWRQTTVGLPNVMVC